MTLFQKCLTMSNPGWAPDQPMDHIFHLSTVALFAYSFLPLQSIYTVYQYNCKYIVNILLKSICDLLNQG